MRALRVAVLALAAMAVAAPSVAQRVDAAFQLCMVGGTCDLEAKAIAEAKGRARREGGRLEITLANGTLVAFDDDPPSGDADLEIALWSYLGNWGELGSHVILQQRYESDECTLVSDATGRRTEIHDLPVPSVDGSYFATVPLLIEGDGGERAQVWSRTRGGYRMEAEIPSDGCAWEWATWTPRGRLRLTCASGGDSCYERRWFRWRKTGCDGPPFQLPTQR